MFQKQARALMHVLACRRGNAMVEFALIAVLVGMVGSIALTSLGANIRTMFTNLATTL